MKWIVKASEEGVCWCTCAEGVARLPGADQLDCPWCGCGWLFMCVHCNRAFTYGRIADVAMMPTEIAEAMLNGLYGKRTPVWRIRDRVAEQSGSLGDVGVEVAVIDGRVLPLDYERSSAGFIGQSGRVHRIDRLPQFETREAEKLLEVLGQPSYWRTLDDRLYG